MYAYGITVVPTLARKTYYTRPTYTIIYYYIILYIRNFGSDGVYT